jgi:hypothetical protein
MNSGVLLIGSLVLMVFASILWHVGDTFFLRDFPSSPWYVASRWLILNVASVPLYAISTYGLYLVKRSWWLVEFPYWIAALLISAFLFRQVLQVSISWREWVSGVLLILIAFLLYKH